jgi:hypothetical protein
MLMLATCPDVSNNVCRSVSVASYGRLPTYNLVLMNYSCISLDASESDNRLERNARDEAQERRGNSDLMRKAGSAAVRKADAV